MCSQREEDAYIYYSHLYRVLRQETKEATTLSFPVSHLFITYFLSPKPVYSFHTSALAP